MNAVLREEGEAPVIPNETVESRLGSLEVGMNEIRASQAGLHARLDKTNEKIDEVNKSLGARIDKTNERIDALNTSLSAQIKAVNTSLSDKLDKLVARIDKQGEEIKSLALSVASVHTTVKVVLAIVGLCVSIAVVMNALRALRWI